MKNGQGIKILHIIDYIGLGGAQTVVKNFFEFQNENTNIFLFSLRNKYPEQKINHKNIFISNSNSKYSLAPIRDIKRIIKSENIDILHCHLPRSQIFGWILKRIYFPKIKLIFHDHGDILFNKKWVFLLKFLHTRVDFFIGVSEAVIKNIYSLTRTKGLVLYNFIDIKKFSQFQSLEMIKKTKEKLGLNNKQLIIGYVGRLEKIKGCKYLIRSLQDIKFDFACLIVGTGKEEKKIKKMVKNNNASDKIKLIGFHEKVQELYSLFDILVIPSLSESFSLTALEGQAAGVPLVASNVPGIKEIIHDNSDCLLFESGNSKDLSKKISALYANKELRNKLILGGLKNVKKYTFETYLKKINNIYIKI